jgi:hypothetical protein
VHHLVQQRVQRLLPAVPADVLAPITISAASPAGLAAV